MFGVETLQGRLTTAPWRQTQPSDVFVYGAPRNKGYGMRKFKIPPMTMTITQRTTESLIAWSVSRTIELLRQFYDRTYSMRLVETLSGSSSSPFTSVL